MYYCSVRVYGIIMRGTLGRLFTVPYFFSWDRLDIPRLTVTAILFFKCTEGAGVRNYSSGGYGARKIKIYFSRFLPNRPRPLSSFDTHARWQRVTQSARFRWSYGKIQDCEQSRHWGTVHTATPRKKITNTASPQKNVAKQRHRNFKFCPSNNLIQTSIWLGIEDLGAGLVISREWDWPRLCFSLKLYFQSCSCLLYTSDAADE